MNTVRSARDLYASLTPADPLAALDVARAFLEQEGDLPESIWHTLGMLQDDPAATWDELDALRAEYFARRGQAPPPYQNAWR